jgi:hypothetical protein
MFYPFQVTLMSGWDRYEEQRDGPLERSEGNERKRERIGQEEMRKMRPIEFEAIRFIFLILQGDGWGCYLRSRR